MLVLSLVLIGLAITLEPIPLTAFILILASEAGVRKGAAFIFGWLASLAPDSTRADQEEILGVVFAIATPPRFYGLWPGVVWKTMRTRPYARTPQPTSAITAGNGTSDHAAHGRKRGERLRHPGASAIVA
jgi:hypothetical protein